MQTNVYIRIKKCDLIAVWTSPFFLRDYLTTKATDLCESQKSPIDVLDHNYLQVEFCQSVMLLAKLKVWYKRKLFLLKLQIRMI